MSLFPDVLWPPPRVVLVVAGWCLVVTGETALVVWTPLVVAALAERFPNPRTAEKAAAEAARLFRYLEVRGARSWDGVTAALVLEWCWAARRDRSGRHRRAAQSTARNRQWTALAAFGEAARLGARIDPGALVGERIARPVGYASARPLTDAEDDLVCRRAESALSWSASGVLVAAARSGGTAAEIALLRVGDVDFAAATVAFGGAAARVNPLDGWSAETMRRFLVNNAGGELSDSDLLCVGEGSDPVRGAHSVTVRLGRVLGDAGLKGRPGVTARSIRLTAARRVLESDGIEAAARFLGVPSLDTAAAALRHRWRCGDG